MDWKDVSTIVARSAPILGTLLGGPAGAAVGGLVAAALGVNSSPDSVRSAIAADPNAALALAKFESDNNVKLQGMLLAHADNEIQADTLRIQADASDRASARQANSNRDEVWLIAVCVLLTFAVLMAVVLYGCYALLQGGIVIKDVSVVAAVSGLVGSVVGYVAANAQTVVNFIYGGSLGSEKKTEALSASVKQAIDVAGKQK